MSDQAGDPAMLTEHRICPGCKQPVVTENGGVVVAFGQSFFHIDCFKCAKCNNQVTADTNLLLLSDGSPVCADCSYCCNVCGLPILDEAIMTGEDSYHAHCFNCKVCKKRIDELVFAKTSQGIYCMPCHSERVARSRRHQERREREKREREKRENEKRAVMAAGGNKEAAYADASTNRVPDRIASNTTHAAVPAAQEDATNGGAHPVNVPAQGHSSTPRSVDFPPPFNLIQRGPSTSAQAPASTTSSAAPSPTTVTSNGRRYSNLMLGRPASPSLPREPSDHSRSASIPLGNVENLSAPSVAGPNKTLQKCKSYDDRPLHVLVHQQNTDPTVNATNVLLVPEGNATSRKEKRRSINPSLVMNYNSLPSESQNNKFSSAPATPYDTRMERPRSPADQDSTFIPGDLSRDLTASPPPLSHNVPRMQLDASRETAPYGRTRSASTDHPHSHLDSNAPSVRSVSPMRLSVTLDRVPARSSSRPEHRTDTHAHVTDTGRRTPQLAEGRASPSLNVPNGSPMARQRSLDDRHRNSTSSLGQTIEIPWRSGNASRPTSPSHRVDVPHSVESGTDTEAEVEEANDAGAARDSLPPLPPPKESKGFKAGTRPPDLKLPQARAEEEERVDLAQGDSEDLSEEPEEEPVESTLTATYIAPALPPIRFSMVGSDFSDILKSMTGQEAKTLEALTEGQHAALKLDVTITPPPTAASVHAPQTPTNEQTDLELEATPVQRKDFLGSRSRSPSPPLPEPPQDLRNGRVSAESLMHRTVSSPEPREGIKTLGGGFMIRKRQRNGSEASLAPPNGFSDHESDYPRVPSPEIIKGTTRPEMFDLVVRKMRESLYESRERGTTQVNIDADTVEAVLTVLHQRHEEYGEMKRRLDGVKRTSLQYMEGLSVAHTEYDKELKARRDAEAEVARLRVLLSGQAVRLAAASGETMRQEAQKQLSQELNADLNNLETSLSKLKLERDMTLAEVEELSATKGSPDAGADSEGAARLSRALSLRFDNIKNQYQGQLLPLTRQKEVLAREIAEMRAMRDAVLAETAAISVRNEALAQLNAQYISRTDMGSDSSHDMERRDASFDRSARPMISTSTTSSTTAFSEDSSDARAIKGSKQEAIEGHTSHHVPRTNKFMKWPGSRTHPQTSGSRDLASNLADVIKAKTPIAHSFQQISVLRVARCDHCGDKMWGSQLRCSNCNVAVHTRCVHLVHLPCSHQGQDHSALLLAPVGPSMFGRDLAEQVRAESRDYERFIPIIVEKCIEAVDALALDYEGIYRKTGGSGLSRVITQLFEKGDYTAFDLHDTERFNDICSVTSVLKNYFRSLPNPLLTYDLHEMFIASSSIRDAEEKRGVISELVSKLPREHYYTTRALMQHLHRVAEQSEHNLMHARNLGVVFGPTLMRSRDPANEFSDMAGKALSIGWLIEHAPSIFPPALPASL